MEFMVDKDDSEGESRFEVDDHDTKNNKILM